MPSRAPFLNVTDQPFQADPTGTQDSTLAFQAALNAAGNMLVPLDERQPNTVLVPAGIYKIERPITIPPYVALEGTWDSPPDCGASFPSPNQPSNTRDWWDPQIYSPFLKGTALVTDYGRGINDRSDIPAFITLVGPSSMLKGVWIFYPLQGVAFYQKGPPHGRSDRPEVFDKAYPVFEVIPYQWTIRATAESCTVSEVLLQ